MNHGKWSLPRTPEERTPSFPSWACPGRFLTSGPTISRRFLCSEFFLLSKARLAHPGKIYFSASLFLQSPLGFSSLTPHHHPVDPDLYSDLQMTPSVFFVLLLQLAVCALSVLSPVEQSALVDVCMANHPARWQLSGYTASGCQTYLTAPCFNSGDGIQCNVGFSSTQSVSALYDNEQS